MKKMILALPLAVSLLTGCTKTLLEYDKASVPVGSKITLLDDTKTRDSARLVMEQWLTDNGYVFDIKEDTKVDYTDGYSMHYVANWGWDLATYMRFLSLKVNNAQQTEGVLKIDTVGCGGFGKFGSAEERIKISMDFLFGKLTEKEALKRICKA